MTGRPSSDGGSRTVTEEDSVPKDSTEALLDDSMGLYRDALDRRHRIDNRQITKY
jgi:hypothetical protein